MPMKYRALSAASMEWILPILELRRQSRCQVNRGHPGGIFLEFL